MNNTKKIFIDGSSGTTGLELLNKIKKNSILKKQVEIITLKDHQRKNPAAKLQAYQAAHLIVLCLPDLATREAIDLINQHKVKVKVLDTSTAYRTHRDWVYGFPELKRQSALIKKSSRVANPGCYASGMISILRPLVAEGLLGSFVQLSAFAISGYSGGGKEMIQFYQAGQKKETLSGVEKSLSRDFFSSYNPYTLDLNHKHLPEVKKMVDLKKNILFQPAVVGTYRGMLVTVPIFKQQFKKEFRDYLSKKSSNWLEELVIVYKNYYKKANNIRVNLTRDDSLVRGAFINPTSNNNTNYLDILVAGNQTATTIHARLDNLGKGASGTALQNIKLMLDLDE